jgi:hypothetical protein
MRNGTFVLRQRVWRFTGGFPLHLHRECLFRGFRRRSARVAVRTGALYQGLTPPHYKISGRMPTVCSLQTCWLIQIATPRTVMYLRLESRLQWSDMNVRTDLCRAHQVVHLTSRHFTGLAAEADSRAAGKQISPNVMEPEEPATGPYCEPAQSSPYCHTAFIYQVPELKPQCTHTCSYTIGIGR